MKIAFALLIMFICAFGIAAQTTPISGNIGLNKPLRILPDNARFQLIPLSVQSFSVFRLDRFTGKTAAYDWGRRRWYPISVRGGLPASSNNAAPKYEMYAEGQGFLINIETGQTWVLLENLTWEPITD